MKKVVFLCSWATPEFMLNRLKKQTPNNSGIWGDIVGTADIRDADYYVILDRFEFPDFINTIDRSKIIHFRMEPDFIHEWKPIEGSTVFDYDNAHHVSIWWIEKSLEYLKSLKPEKKKKKVSVISSSKWNHRSNYVKQIDENFHNLFDYYGNIQIENNKNFGYLDRSIKYDALLNYQMSLAIENSSQKNYFSEKIVDCMLLWTIPLYWGCPNISDYFPEYSYRLIDINDPLQIKEVIEEPITQKEIESLRESRNLIIEKYNIWPIIQKII